MKNKKKAEFIGSLYGFTGRSYAGTVWNKDAIAPTINSMQGGGRTPMIIEEENDTEDSGNER